MTDPPPSSTTMTPHTSPRPSYPPFTRALAHFLTLGIRGPLLCALVSARLLPLVSSFSLRMGNKLGTHNETLLFGLLLPIVHASSYLGTFAFFESVERLGVFREYKIPRTKSQIPSEEMKWAAFWESVKSWGGMVFGGGVLYQVMTKLRGSPRLFDEKPKLMRSFWDIAGAGIMANVSFYFVHRLLHSQYLYWIHKKHHKFVGTIAVSAESLGSVEQVVQTLPVIVGPLLFGGMHPIDWLLFLAWRVSSGMEGHSGYSFRNSFLHKIGLTNADDACYHDFHHTYYNKGNFGVFYMDWLFGTFDHWLVMGEEDGYLAHCEQRKVESDAREAKNLEWEEVSHARLGGE